MGDQPTLGFVQVVDQVGDSLSLDHLGIFQAGEDADIVAEEFGPGAEQHRDEVQVNLIHEPGFDGLTRLRIPPGSRPGPGPTGTGRAFWRSSFAAAERAWPVPGAKEVPGLFS